MPLTGKYLKYSPEITLEIFTLVWNKLIELGFQHKYNNNLSNEFNSFIDKHNYLIIEDGRFNTYLKSCIFDNKETTVQEILGYDPFVKDDFVLPKKWCIKIQANGIPHEVAQWRKSSWSSPGYILSSGMWDCDNAIGYTEITFEQFKKYVLKDHIETSKETNPEYVECINVATCNTKVGEIFKCRHSDGYFEWEYNNKSMRNYNSWDGWSVPWSDELPQKHFKPSTKEAFDAQNKPIEKWSIGSYIVFLQNEVLTRSGKVTKGKLYELTTTGRCPYFKDDNNYPVNFIANNYKSFGLEWFATKSEAEEFAKTLVEPVKEEVKQPLKQAVHCTTQEEWDFVTEKLGYKWSTYSGWSVYKNNTCIGLKKLGFGTAKVAYKEYQILSFQEWCDLNGYKMEKSKQEILKEFAEKYPPGTKVKSPYGIEFIISTTHKHRGENNDFLQGSPYYIGLCGEVLAVKENSCIGEYLYKRGKYAEIIKDAPKFEVGKWYKGDKDYYIKFLNIENCSNYNKIHGETINCRKYQKVDYWASNSLEKEALKNGPLTDLSEIQQYLPDNHPDKIKSNREFKVGKWYRVTDGKCRAIGKNIWYAKSPRIINGLIECEEHWHKQICKGGDFGEIGYYTFTEISIEEIQQYLPDDHPDKIKVDRKFKVGDFVIIKSWHYNKNIQLNQIAQIKAINLTSKTPYKLDMSVAPKGSITSMWYFKLDEFIHATPEEINNHLISIGQIPAGEPLNTGVEPNKDGAFKYTTLPGSSWSGGTIQNHLEAMIPTTGNCYSKDFATSYIPVKPKMILSIDDEELPMVNIIKTNTIKQLLNND